VPLICEFMTEHRQEFGVAPIWRALTFLGVPIAPRTYFAHVARSPSKRALWDMSITEILAGYYTPDARGRRPPESLYGSPALLPAAQPSRWRGCCGFPGCRGARCPAPARR